MVSGKVVLNVVPKPRPELELGAELVVVEKERLIVARLLLESEIRIAIVSVRCRGERVVVWLLGCLF